MNLLRWHLTLHVHILQIPRDLFSIQLNSILNNSDSCDVKNPIIGRECPDIILIKTWNPYKFYGRLAVAHAQASINLFRTLGSYLTHENWPLNWPNFAAWPLLPGWPAHSRHTVACMHRFSHIGMHASIFSHTRTTTWAGSLVYVRVESGRDRPSEEIWGSTDHFQQFWNGYGSERVNFNHPFKLIGR